MEKVIRSDSKILRFKDQPFFNLLLSFVVTPFSIIYNGYFYAENDHVLQLPLAAYFQNNSLYPRDPLFAQNNYKSFFWEGLGWSSKFLSLWFTTFVLYFLSIFLFYYFLIKIGNLITESHLGGILLMFLFFTPKPGLGYAITSHDLWLSMRVVTLPFLMLALYLHLKEKYLLSFLLLGLTFNIHPISAIQLAFIQGIHLLLTRKPKKDGLKILLQSTFLFVVSAIPLLLFVISNFGDPNSELTILSAPSDWIKIMKIRNGHIIFPSTYSPLTVYANVIFYLVLFLLSIKRLSKEVRSYYVNFMFPIGILFLINFIFSEIIFSGLIIQLQFARSLRFLGLFTLIVYSISIHDMFRSDKLELHDLIFLSFYPFLVFSSYFILTVIGSMFIGFIMKLQYPKFGLIINKKTLKTDFKQILRLNRTMLVIGLLIAGSFVPYLIGNKIQFGSITPPIEIRIDKNDPWIDVQLWVKRNLSPEVILITPPHLEGFRVFSEHSIIGEWKDGTLGFFNASFARDWWQRMLDLGYNESNYKNYTDEYYSSVNFSSVALKYRAQYLIGFVDKNISITGNQLYENSEFIVMEFSEYFF